MKKIKLLAVGSVKESYLRNRIKKLSEEVNKTYKLELIEVPDESIPKNPSETEINNIKKAEGDKLLSHIDPKDYVVALCIDGKPTDNSDLRRIMEKAYENYASSVVYVIGGSLGLSDEVVRRANYRASFSDMTFPHQLMRVMLLEALTYDS